VEDGGIGDKELLVAGSDKRCGEVCRRVQFMSEDEKQNGRTSGKVKVK